MALGSSLPNYSKYNSLIEMKPICIPQVLYGDSKFTYGPIVRPPTPGMSCPGLATRVRLRNGSLGQALSG
jgi:hypothetical protein